MPSAWLLLKVESSDRGGRTIDEHASARVNCDVPVKHYVREDHRAGESIGEQAAPFGRCGVRFDRRIGDRNRAAAAAEDATAGTRRSIRLVVSDHSCRAGDDQRAAVIEDSSAAIIQCRARGNVVVDHRSTLNGHCSHVVPKTASFATRTVAGDGSTGDRDIRRAGDVQATTVAGIGTQSETEQVVIGNIVAGDVGRGDRHEPVDQFQTAAGANRFVGVDDGIVDRHVAADRQDPAAAAVGRPRCIVVLDDDIAGRAAGQIECAAVVEDPAATLHGGAANSGSRVAARGIIRHHHVAKVGHAIESQRARGRIPKPAPFGLGIVERDQYRVQPHHGVGRDVQAAAVTRRSAEAQTEQIVIGDVVVAEHGLKHGDRAGDDFDAAAGSHRFVAFDHHTNHVNGSADRQNAAATAERRTGCRVIGDRHRAGRDDVIHKQRAAIVENPPATLQVGGAG